MKFLKAGDTLFKLIYGIAGDKYKDFVNAYIVWKKVVGKKLSQHSKVKKLKDNTLFVGVSNSVWLQELLLLKRKILKDLNNNLDFEISEIVFYITKL